MKSVLAILNLTISIIDTWMCQLLMQLTAGLFPSGAQGDQGISKAELDANTSLVN